MTLRQRCGLDFRHDDPDWSARRLGADNDNFSGEDAAGKKLLGRCPNCSAPAVVDFRPFCSGRCKDLDLARWLRGTYAIPGGNSDADEDGDDARLEAENMSRSSNPESD